MKTITYTAARDHLASVLKETEDTREPMLICRRGHEDVALIPAAELSSLMETVHLLRSPANARRLLAAIDDSYSGKTKPVTINGLREFISS
jgi:antitoxin YefM